MNTRVIDVHAHVTPRVLTEAKRTGSDLHGLRVEDIERGRQIVQSAEERLASMDALGVDVQVLSTGVQMYLYGEDPEPVAAIHRACNDEVHEAAVAHPGRFAGLAILPMQDVGLAVAELRRATGELGLVGAMIGDHVNGVMYDDPRFEPLWDEAERLGALIFLHQATPTLVSVRTERYHLFNTVGNLVERTLSFASLVFGGVMDRHPRLEVCLAHGGGYAAYGAGRLDWGWQWRPSAREHVAAAPSSYLSRFSYDSITHSETALRFLIDAVGVERVVFGTDYPGFATGREAPDYAPVAWLAGLHSLSDAEKGAILAGNLERMLGL